MEESQSLLVGENKKGSVAGKSTSELLVDEVQKVCYIALPMVVTTISVNLLRVASMAMVGHLGELQLASTAIATSLTNVTGFSLLLGMACALETLCGQAYGAGQFEKLGVYTYGGIISLLLVCLPISLLWIFMDKLLILIGQDPLISAEARKFSVWLIPSLFPYAILQLLIRYLQSQSLIFPMLWSSIVTLLFHIPVCWAFVFTLELGTVGAALAIGISYTLNVILLWLYVKYSSACEKTRLYFSDGVFPSMREFFRFGIPSAGMICLEWWTFEMVILLAGLLPNPQLQTSVLSICLNISSLHYYIPSSFGAAASTRVSNELGAGNPKAARMAVWGVFVIGVAELVIAGTTLLCCRNILGYAFGNEKEVLAYVKEMTPFVCASMMVDSLGGILSGISRGSGWQQTGAYITLGAYYLAGIPVALMLGFVLHFSGKGLWVGIIVGTLVQAILLALLTCFTDWQKQDLRTWSILLTGQSNDGVYEWPTTTPSARPSVCVGSKVSLIMTGITDVVIPLNPSNIRFYLV